MDWSVSIFWVLCPQGRPDQMATHIVLDLLPDDPGHFITVDFHDRVLDYVGQSCLAHVPPVGDLEGRLTLDLFTTGRGRISSDSHHDGRPRGEGSDGRASEVGDKLRCISGGRWGGRALNRVGPVVKVQQTHHRDSC